eukprot:835966-Pyramimonas_sp.AAC.1
MLASGLEFESRRPGGNLAHPGADRPPPKGHALKVALHDGYLPAKGDAGKVIPVAFVPRVAIALGVQVRWQACGLAVGLK